MIKHSARHFRNATFFIMYSQTDKTFPSGTQRYGRQLIGLFTESLITGKTYSTLEMKLDGYSQFNYMSREDYFMLLQIDFFLFYFSYESHSVVSNSLQPRNSPGQNTGVGSLSLLQGIFPTQGSNLGLLHCRWILHQLSYRGSPYFSYISCLKMV